MLDESSGLVGRKADAPEEPVLPLQQHVAAQIAKVEFDAHCNALQSPEDAGANLNRLNLTNRDDDGMEEKKPALQFKSVGVDAILLPETLQRALRGVKRRGVHGGALFILTLRF
jgi:hypothetical protein